MLESDEFPSHWRLTVYEDFARIGRDCFRSGLISSHAGNISTRSGNSLTITRHGATLGRLCREDLLTVGMGAEEDAGEASCELPTHRAVYAATEAGALLHTHPPHGIVLSLMESRILPLDVEGLHVVGEVPVVNASSPVASLEMAALIAEALGEYRLCMLRGHGLFVRGETLGEAFCLTTAFEASARVGYLARVIGVSSARGPELAPAPSDPPASQPPSAPSAPTAPSA